MSLIAITREVSPTLANCELSFHPREEIDVHTAAKQHRVYQECLARLGARVLNLEAQPELPDAVFVEDPAIVLDELAVILNSGAESRRPEAATLADTLAKYRPLKFVRDPGTLDGGDILRAERAVFVGMSRRTNREGFRQLREILTPYGYELHAVELQGCLHLKSACSYLGNNTMLINRSFVNVEPLRRFNLLEVSADEPLAGNVLVINGTVVMPATFPGTRRLLESQGFRVCTVDVSELQKAEAGVTCCSLIFAE
jgi:dimethylargininase